MWLTIHHDGTGDLAPVGLTGEADRLAFDAPASG